MEPDSLLRQPREPEVRRGESDFSETLREALAQCATHAAQDSEAVETICSVVQPLLPTYGEPVPVAHWRDVHGVAARELLETGGATERGLLILDGMAHIFGEPRTAREGQRWLLEAEARRHQVYLARDAGLVLLAWRPAPMLRGGRVVQDHWRARVRPVRGHELLANYPVDAFMEGIQEALTRRVERSRQWAEFIRRLNAEFEAVLG